MTPDRDDEYLGYPLPDSRFLVATLCAKRGFTCQRNVCIKASFVFFNLYQVKRLWDQFYEILGGSAIAAPLTALWKSQLMPPCGSRRF